ncbi:hypothetical protein CVT24_011557 [Panaeolus cyanescens]|uniref:Uncharacterized protein n=1 Tax=Panaeolus cyanescens TaxID=181874 RepID=A0A409VLX4_9AGAR|nr:hypothetical protein CVT24_011557 [Panaeolus cyanescens]
MTAPFSWTDTINVAIGSCLPCLKPQSIALSPESEDESRQHHDPAINRIPRARPDELQGLLRDPESTDGEAEILSLHSNPGRSNNKNRKKAARRKKKRTGLDGGESSGPRQITLFGYNLFGRRDNGVRLEDGDDAIYGDSVRRTRRAGGDGRDSGEEAATRTVSTFDSDAAPLDPETIAALSMSSPPPGPVQALEPDTPSPDQPSTTSTTDATLPTSDPTTPTTPISSEEAAKSEAQRLHEKALRKAARRERRAAREEQRLAEAFAANAKAQLALGLDINGAEAEFEGFQGSGGVGVAPSALKKPKSRLRSDSVSASGSGSTSGSTSRTGSTSRSGRQRHSISYGQSSPYMLSGVPSPLGPGSNLNAYNTTTPPLGLPVVSPQQQDDDDDDADLDGGLYASRSGRKYKAGGSGTGGSDSRSRTSASRSERASGAVGGYQPQLQQHFTTVPNSHSQLYTSVNGRSPTVPQFGAGVVHDPRGLLDRNKKTSSKSHSASSRTTKSHSSNASVTLSASAPQSPSLASPLSSTFQGASPVVGAGPEVISPSTVEQGQGFFDLDDGDEMAEYAARRREEKKREKAKKKEEKERLARERALSNVREGEETNAQVKTLPQSDFPITGFGGGAGRDGGRKMRDYGAFLARRDEEAGDGL